MGEDEKQALHLQLTKFESRLIASEEERKAVELSEKRKNVRLSRALSEQKLRNASEMQQRLTCERGLRSQLATVREGLADSERGLNHLARLEREASIWSQLPPRLVALTAAEAATSQRSAEHA